MPITAERLEVDVDADTSKAERKLGSFSKSTDRAGRSATGMGRKFSAAGALVKAAAGGMAAVMAGKVIMSASDLNETLSKTGVVFGPATKIVTKQADKMADQFGIVKQEFLDGASAIGLVGKASGLTQKAAAGLGADFATLAGDAASFYNVPVADALNDMRSGLVGESEPMRKYGVLLNETAVKAEAVRLGIAGANDELTEGQKVQARASLITKGMADAQGDLARTSDSVANQMREIKGRVVNFAASMGTKALPAVSKFLALVLKAPGFIKRTWEALKGWVNGNADATRALNLLKAAGAALLQQIKDLPKTVQNLRDKFVALVGGTERAKDLLKLVAGGLAGIAAATAAAKVLNMIRTAFAALNAVMALNPFVLIAFAIGAAVVGLVMLYRRSEEFRNKVNEIAAVVKGALGTALTYVQGLWAQWQPKIMEVIGILREGLGQAIDAVVAKFKVWGPQIAQILGFVAQVIGAYIKFMVPIWQAGFKLIWNVVKVVFKAVWGIIKGAMKIIVGIIDTVLGVLTGDWKQAWNGIKSILSGVWKIITSVVKGAWGLVKAIITGGLGILKAAWSQAWNLMKSLLGKVWDGIKSGVKSGITAVVGFVKGLPGKIKGVFAGAGTWLLQIGKDIINGLKNGIDSAFGAVKDKLSSLTNMIPKWKGPYEKDKRLLVKNGRVIIKGLVRGLSQGEPQVKRYLKNLTKWIRDGFGGQTEKRLLDQVKRTRKRMRALMEREEKITDRLRAQLARKARLKDERKDFISSMSQGIMSQANVLNAGNNAATIRSSLEAQVAKAKQFAKDLKAMRKMGYPRALIAQVAGAGIEGGAEVAKALVAASADDAAAIGAAFNEIRSIAKSQSKQLGNALYNSGIRAADGMIKGLKDKRKDLEDVLIKIAKGMEKAIKRALGIKSPSRVFAKVGAFTAEGLIGMLRRKVKDAAKAGKALAHGVVQGFQNGPQDGLGGGPGPFLPPPPPGAFPGASGGAGVSFHFTTVNPVAEPESRTTNKALDRVATLGLV